MTTRSIPQFRSFFQVGYECTASLAAKRRRLNLLSATRHDEYCRMDYTLIKQLGIHTVREGLSWSHIDKGNGHYDFDRYKHMMQIAKEEGIEQIWDLNHFDYPEYVDPFSDKFTEQFAEYAKRCVHIFRKYISGTLFIVPVNEISFFSWIGADQGHWAPYKKGAANGFKFKCQLVKASIRAMDAIWEMDEDVRFIQVDPYMRRVAKSPANKKARVHTDDFNNKIRFEAWDLLSGKTHPEIGGDPKYLDIIGVNYYFHNQEWVLSKKNGGIEHAAMEWEDPERVSLGSMLQEIYTRYHRPILISETGSFGELRYRWWQRTLEEVKTALEEGLLIVGVCAYPALDRPESAGFLLPNSGLWDFVGDDPKCVRVPHERSIEVIQQFILQNNHAATD